MMKNLEGTILGIWSAHGEGKFSFPYEEENMKSQGNIIMGISFKS